MAIQLEDYAIEKSTFGIQATFTDEADQAVTPDSITWTLCNADGDVINNRKDVEVTTPASTVIIVLKGDDLKLLDPENDFEERFLEISAQIDSSLGSDLPVKQNAKFKVFNLKSVS